MSLVDLKAKLKEDVELAAKFKGLKDLDEVISLAKTNGYEVTKEELQEIGDDDLDSVSGGCGLVDAHECFID